MKQKIKIYLVDKNTNDLLFLGHFKQSAWQSAAFRATTCSRNVDFIREHGVVKYACNLHGTATSWRTVPNDWGDVPSEFREYFI